MDIYRKDKTEDYVFDTIKAQNQYQKIKHPKKDVLVDLNRFKKRSFRDLVTATEAYSNIERENQRAAYMKKLLNS